MVQYGRRPRLVPVLRWTIVVALGIFGSIGLLVAVPLIGTTGYWYWDQYQFEKHSPVIASLAHGSEAEIEKAFQQWIAQTFRAGMPAETVDAILRDQGFTPTMTAYGATRMVRL